MWAQKHSVSDEREFLGDLPDFLLHDIIYHLNKDLVSKIPMFMQADSTVIMEINRYLTRMVAPTNEYVVRKGEISRDMYFIISGSLDILDDYGNAVSHLYEGSVAGEVSFLLGIPCPHDIKTTSRTPKP